MYHEVRERIEFTLLRTIRNQPSNRFTTPGNNKRFTGLNFPEQSGEMSFRLVYRNRFHIFRLV